MSTSHDNYAIDLIHWIIFILPTISSVSSDAPLRTLVSTYSSLSTSTCHRLHEYLRESVTERSLMRLFVDLQVLHDQPAISCYPLNILHISPKFIPYHHKRKLILLSWVNQDVHELLMFFDHAQVKCDERLTCWKSFCTTRSRGATAHEISCKRFTKLYCFLASLLSSSSSLILCRLLSRPLSSTSAVMILTNPRRFEFPKQR